jgi:ribosome-binding factor A
MNTKSINLKKTQSLLMELIPEALSTLNNKSINSLMITKVDCKAGKHDAKVYFDGSDFDSNEVKIIQNNLNKASGRIKSYCLGVTGWYRCPSFTFFKDDGVNESARMDQLFHMIKKTT